MWTIEISDLEINKTLGGVDDGSLKDEFFIQDVKYADECYGYFADV